MEQRKRAGALAAAALVALAAAIPAAYAQIAPPPDRIDVYHYGGTPKVEPGDMPENWSARQNVIDSDRYERLVHTDPAFRAARIRQECGPINEPDLYQQCVVSFGR